MKANRKFVEGEEAVSAVIGVILMVAITVAIAATVYVYVSGMLGSGPESSATVTMVQSGSFISVSKVQNGPVTMSGTGSDMINVINQTTGTAQAGTYAINNGAGNSATLVEGGDTISLSFTASQNSGTKFTVQLLSGDDVIGTCVYTVQ